jgi:hypothetical protein
MCPYKDLETIPAAVKLTTISTFQFSEKKKRGRRAV